MPRERSQLPALYSTSCFCKLLVPIRPARVPGRLADLLDAPALLAECVAVLGCIAPGPDLIAPLLALAEARQYHTGLQRLKASVT